MKNQCTDAKFLSAYVIQTDHVISVKWPDLVIVNKKMCIFAVLAGHRVKIKESEKRDKYVDFSKEQKKTMDHKIDADTNYHIYQPPPIGQDTTQGQFLNEA